MVARQWSLDNGRCESASDEDPLKSHMRRVRVEEAVRRQGQDGKVGADQRTGEESA